MKRANLVCRLVAVSACCLLLGRVQAAGPRTGGTAVLDMRSPWRCHFTWSTEQVRRAVGDLEFCQPQFSGRPVPPIPLKKAEPRSTDVPPAAWTAIEFDDASWVRLHGPLQAPMTRNLALICVRGRFTVADPAKVGELELTLTFRGGALAYLNGREIARGHLPEGRIDADTPAADYPTDAYVSPEGVGLRWVGFGDPEKYKDRFALRERRLQVKVPADALRKGVNVLAVEVHRAPTAEILYTCKTKDDYSYTLWEMVGLDEATLSSAADAAVTPNISRPKGLQVWNQPAYLEVLSVDYADPDEKLRPMTLAAARGGAASGQVVVSCEAAIAGLNATAGDLSATTGGAIPASAVQVRYAASAEYRRVALMGRPVPALTDFVRSARCFDALEEAPPAEAPLDKKAGGAVQPVWVTVHVPRDAKPGEYAGTLTIAANGAAPVAVPIRLSVADWTVPPPAEFQTLMEFVQSPDTLSARFGVPMWSEEHWKLIDRSFAYLGQLGAKVIHIPAIRRTYFGNEQSMVRWKSAIRNPQSAIQYTPDFSIVERYLDTAVTHLGKVPVVCVYCWDHSTGGAYMGGGHDQKANGMPITVFDPATGKVEAAEGPKWGEPACREFWKPVFDGLRDVLRKRGIEKSMMVGIAGDIRPPKAAVEDLKAVAPDAPWVVASHTNPRNIGQPVGYNSVVWGVTGPLDPADGRRFYGWKNPAMTVIHPRFGCGAIAGTGGLQLGTDVAYYRGAAESVLTARGFGQGLRGIGRSGADLWSIFPNSDPRRTTVAGRYPETANWHGGDLTNESYPFILAPGKNGALGTIRFEALLENLQECEARIFIEKALLDPARNAELGAHLARRCQAVLDTRVRAIVTSSFDRRGRCACAWYAAGVTQRAADLYAAAAEVARQAP